MSALTLRVCSLDAVYSFAAALGVTAAARGVSVTSAARGVTAAARGVTVTSL